MMTDQAPTLASASTGIAAAAVAVPSSTNTGGVISSSDSRSGQNDLENYMTTFAGNAIGLQQAVEAAVGGVAGNASDIKDLGAVLKALAESVAGNTESVAGNIESVAVNIKNVAGNTSSITFLIGALATTDKVLKLHTTQIDNLTQSVAALKEDARLSKKKFEEIEENQ